MQSLHWTSNPVARIVYRKSQFFSRRVISMRCFDFEELHFTNPTLKSVQVSYLLTLTDSTRRDSYMHQLAKHRPTARVIIVHNKGYKNCRKQGVVSPAQDLWHANQLVAHISGAEPFVLMLEDDVQFNREFSKQARSIDKFIRQRRCQAFAYNLGMFSFVSIPWQRQHLRVMSGGFSHAVIYSRAALDQFSTIRIPSWGLHDVVVFSYLKCYTPREACAVQPYERTNNAKYWDAFHIVHALDEICKHNPCRLFKVYDKINTSGGLLTVLSASVILVMQLSYHERSFRVHSSDKSLL